MTDMEGVCFEQGDGVYFLQVVRWRLDTRYYRYIIIIHASPRGAHELYFLTAHREISS